MNPRSATPRNVLVTGASAGLGLAITHALLADGHRIWGTARDPSRLPGHEHLHSVALDLGDYDSIRRAAAQVEVQAGAIDVLVNNAGSGVFGPLESFDGDELERQFRLLAHGPMRLTAALLPGMRARGSGLVINVTSLAAGFPVPFLAGYSAAKAALAAYTESLRHELAGSGIGVVELRLGDVQSEFHQRMQRPVSPLDTAYAHNAARAFRAIDARARRAPGADGVALAVRRVVAAPERAPPRIAVGGMFQSVASPLGARVLPYRALQYLAARYFGLRP